jgi:hypothetical protein
VRATAAQALALAGDRRAAARALADPDAAVRETARTALEST